MTNAHRDEPVNANEPLENAIVGLLRRIPERWAEYELDDLTATESQALFLLVAAGLVERRIRLRTRLHNHPVAVEATLTATGEYGIADALEPMLASMWEEWKDAYQAWQSGETREAPSSITEHLKPDEWRLTDRGGRAVAGLDGGQTKSVLDFVLCRGLCDGQPRLIPGPGGVQIAQRKPVRGYGKLVRMQKVQADATPAPTVNIGNWQEGADVFVAASESAMKQLTAAVNKTLQAMAKAAEPTVPAKPASAQNTTQIPEIEKPFLAMAILLEAPDITPTELAQRIGVSRSTLYSRSPKWAAVRKTLLAREDYDKHGEIDADGNLDAWREDAEDE